jgi:hypothetical protein
MYYTLKYKNNYICSLFNTSEIKLPTEYTDVTITDLWTHQISWSFRSFVGMYSNKQTRYSNVNNELKYAYCSKRRERMEALKKEMVDIIRVIFLNPEDGSFRQKDIKARFKDNYGFYSEYLVETISSKHYDIINYDSWIIEEHEKHPKDISNKVQVMEKKDRHSWLKLTSKNRFVAYCHRCGHIIPKDMLRLIYGTSTSGICPLCLLDLAKEAQAGIDQYDKAYMEQMMTNRFIGNL